MNTQANYNQIPEKELVNVILQAKAGNQSAFARIYEHYFDRIFKFIYYRVSHRETAEDLTEDVFVKVFHKLKGLKETQAFEGWLFQISRNLVIDYYRTKKTLVDLEHVENILEYETNLIDVISLEQNQKLLLELIKQLPADDQTIIKLRFFEDLDSDTIAVMLAKTAGAVRVMQHRALAKLKQLADNHFPKQD